ncbi:hypothetical protein AnigIFM63309_003014 [Aspergillus niger]|nr:hypothetical protein AnigIFM63309_003014 [Aspergillus niger]
MAERFRQAFRNEPLENIGPNSPLIHAFRGHLQDFTTDNAQTPGSKFSVPLPMRLDFDNPEIYDRARGNIVLTTQDLRSFLDPVVNVAVRLIRAQAGVVAKAGFGTGLKGEKYDEGPVRTEEFTEYFLNGATPSTRYMSIYTSDAENPPQTVVG